MLSRWFGEGRITRSTDFARGPVTPRQRAAAPMLSAPAPEAPSYMPPGAAARDPSVGPQRSYGGDPLGRLPPAAAAKLNALIDHNADSGAAVREISQRRSQIAEGRRVPLSRLEMIRSGRQYAGRDQDIERTGRDLELIDEQLRGFDARIDRLVAGQWHGTNRILDWLRDIPPGVLIEPHPKIAAPKLAKGETAAERVAALRERTASLRADLHSVASAPIFAADAKAIMVRQIAELAERGRPDVMGCAEIGSEIKFRTMLVNANAPRTWFEHVDTLGLLAWLHGDEIARRLAAEIDEVADDSAALSDADRTAKERELLAEILECERLEEATIEAAEAAGAEAVARRLDVDPRALLGLASELPPARR
jgi:hypothetical protein